MRIRWKGFELPTKVVCEKETYTTTYGKFIVEPFERGYAATIGNSLRRILLSSLEGAALTTMRVEGVQHQYSTIPGVVEDVTDMVLNLKKVLLKIDSEGEKSLSLEVSGPCEVTARNLRGGPEVTILNPDLHVATITEEKGAIKAKLTARRDRGYATAQENEKNEIGVIPMDSIFSPITRVRYAAENTRVGQMTNYDKLIMEIWTNGAVTPEMALVEAAKILRKHLDPFIYYTEVGEKPMLEPSERKEMPVLTAGDTSSLRAMLDMSVAELELSVRAENCLESQNIKTIRQLVSKSENELLGLRNFGKTSLEDIKEKLAGMGLSLGMHFDTSPEGIS